MLNIISIVCVLFGALFFFSTSIGLIRLPDFYTRMHAAGKGDTLSTVLLLLGCSIYVFKQGHADFAAGLVCLKILFISFFVFIGSPTATHAIMDAGYETEIKHWTKKTTSKSKKAST